MPTYDYVCQDCGNKFDIRASIAAYSEGLHPHCPECGSTNAARRFSAVNVLTSTGGPLGAPQSASSRCGSSGFG